MAWLQLRSWMCRRFFRSFLHSMMSLWRLRGGAFRTRRIRSCFFWYRPRAAKAREDRLQAADEAACLRRMAAVEKERVIRENELENRCGRGA